MFDDIPAGILVVEFKQDVPSLSGLLLLKFRYFGFETFVFRRGDEEPHSGFRRIRSKIFVIRQVQFPKLERCLCG